MLTAALQQVIEQLEQLEPNLQDLFAVYIQQKLPIGLGQQPGESLLATIPYSRDYPDTRGQMIRVYQSFLTTPHQHIWRSAIRKVWQTNLDPPLVVGYDGRADVVLELADETRIALSYLGYEEGEQLARILEQSLELH